MKLSFENLRKILNEKLSKSSKAIKSEITGYQLFVIKFIKYSTDIGWQISENNFINNHENDENILKLSKNNIWSIFILVQPNQEAR